MNNIDAKYDEKTGKLTLTIDTRRSFGESKSGKSVMVASTNGNTRIGDVTVGVNVYRSISEVRTVKQISS
jgi:hypothetical protein